jgi:hypothetical protein
MTPPDPATPSPLEALLKEVDKIDIVAIEGTREASENAVAMNGLRAPRLAAIVRVLREATERMLEADCFMDACAVQATALRRADEIAGGGA